MTGEAAPDGILTAAGAVVSEVLYGRATREQVADRVHEAAAAAGLPDDDAVELVHALVACDPRFQAVEPDAALEGQLRALLFLAPASHASLWLVEEGDEVCLARVGVSRSSKAARACARQALNGGARKGSANGGLKAVPVQAGSAPRAALVVQARNGGVRRTLALSEVTGAAVAPILERRLLRADALRSGERLLDAAERRISRMGFDIHDGPLQGLALLAGELASVRRELEALPLAEDAARRLAGLEELTVGLERELRELSLSAGTSGLIPLREQLERDVEHFRRWSGMRAHLEIEGDVERTTRSQRLAVHRVVEEALANVREHSRAHDVLVSLRRDVDVLHLTIADDGRGFDVRRAMRRAGSHGRLGLGSMAERVRLLGGRLEISSAPGGPTVVSATLPAWEPPGRASA
jgi:signal transduction histidine kinase